MKIVALLLMLTLHAIGFIRTPYSFIDAHTFQFSVDYNTQSFDSQNGKITLGGADALFRFNDLFFGISPQKGVVNSDSFNETHFTFGFQILDRSYIGPLHWSMQVGAYSLGMSEAFRDSAYSTFYVDYALSHFVTHNNMPFFIVFSTLFSEGIDPNNVIVFGIHNSVHHLFIEYDELTTQLYLGLNYYVRNNINGELIVNVSSDQHTNDEGVFNPAVKLGLRVNDIFSTRKPDVPQTPLPVDEAVFTLMEQGLLAYSQEDYLKAATAYRQVVEGYPNFVLAYVRLGNCYYQLKQFELAKKSWSSALRLDPSNEAVFMALIQLKNRQYQIDDLVN
ncbi:MAG: tetratricopeptide repeat protein [Candidatus Margulisiibacteriota bacterium]|nr:tetratricopeptide repeat protein [Candidatus Margulisiibacteriota bacterium]